MKYLHSLILLSLLIFQSCCFKKGEEIAKVSYTQEEKAVIPYQDAELIDFITNDNFEFQLLASEITWFSNTQEHCEDYTTYENYRVDLASEIPNLNIELRLGNPNFFDGIDEVEGQPIRITVNRIQFLYNALPLETLEIDGVVYENVLRYEAIQEDSPISTILVNKTRGILKINYTNGDYAQIN